jgi:hypothetical protein
MFWRCHKLARWNTLQDRAGKDVEKQKRDGDGSDEGLFTQFRYLRRIPSL